MAAPLRSIILVCVAGAAIAASCGTSDSPDGGVAVSPSQLPPLRVSAAASLTDAFSEIADNFTTDTGARVELNIAGSSVLAEQILRGAPTDVFASADRIQMEVVEDHLATEPEEFARNELVLVSRPERPVRDLLGFGSLAQGGEVVAVCEPVAPCGRLAERALADADVELAESSVSRTLNVRAALASVASGDAVAGLVYASDVSALAVQDGATPLVSEAVGDPGVSTEYVVGGVRSDDRGSVGHPMAQKFISYLRGEESRTVLDRWGFR